jgi:putative alpha-1,2-mannosidase
MIFADLIDLPQSRTNGTASVNSTTGRITGSGTFSPSFGIGNYDLHFCADFSGADIYDTGVFVNDRAGNEPKTVHVLDDGINDDESYSAGAFVRFEPGSTSVIARVGVSFLSVDKACSNGETEIPQFDFNSTKQAAQDAWREKLGVISIDAGGVSPSFETIFWSGLYRAHLSPQDYTGENPLWNSTEPYYDSYYW